MHVVTGVTASSLSRLSDTPWSLQQAVFTPMSLHTGLLLPPVTCPQCWWGSPSWTYCTLVTSRVPPSPGPHVSTERHPWPCPHQPGVPGTEAQALGLGNRALGFCFAVFASRWWQWGRPQVGRARACHFLSIRPPEVTAGPPEAAERSGGQGAESLKVTAATSGVPPCDRETCVQGTGSRQAGGCSVYGRARDGSLRTPPHVPWSRVHTDSPPRCCGVLVVPHLPGRGPPHVRRDGRPPHAHGKDPKCTSVRFTGAGLLGSPPLAIGSPQRGSQHPSSLGPRGQPRALRLGFASCSCWARDGLISLTEGSRRCRPRSTCPGPLLRGCCGLTGRLVQRCPVSQAPT